MSPRVKHPRCPSCPPTVTRCTACVIAYNRDHHAKRLADPVSAAALRERRQAEYQRRKAQPGWLEAKVAKQKAARAAKRGEGPPPRQPGQQPTRPRCEACPPTGKPCRPCLNAHRRSMRPNVEREPRVVTPGPKRQPAKPKLTAEQREERARLAAEAKAAKAQAAADLKAAREAQKKRESSRGSEALAEELARESRYQVCRGACMTRGRFENGYCKRCQAYANPPNLAKKAILSYTSRTERTA